MAVLQKDASALPVGLSFSSVRPDVSSPSLCPTPFADRSHSHTPQRYLPWSLSSTFRMCSWNTSWETFSVWNFCLLRGLWNSSPYFTTLVWSICRIVSQDALGEMEEKYQMTANGRFPGVWDKILHSMAVLELMESSRTWLLEFTFSLLSTLKEWKQVLLWEDRISRQNGHERSSRAIPPTSSRSVNSCSSSPSDCSSRLWTT